MTVHMNQNPLQCLPYRPFAAHAFVVCEVRNQQPHRASPFPCQGAVRPQLVEESKMLVVLERAFLSLIGKLALSRPSRACTAQLAICGETAGGGISASRKPCSIALNTDSTPMLQSTTSDSYPHRTVRKQLPALFSARTLQESV